jgi:hypothetical protein
MDVMRAVPLLAATLSMGLVAGVFGLYAHTIMPGLGRTESPTWPRSAGGSTRRGGRAGTSCAWSRPRSRSACSRGRWSCTAGRAKCFLGVVARPG